MTEKLSQTLLENAISSLKEGLIKYKNASNLEGDPCEQYKFSILHFSHFIELCLKYYVSSLHPLLIYANPSDKNLASYTKRLKVKTISIDKALQLIINNNVEIPQDFVDDLEFLKVIRNQIMHYKFVFNSSEVDEKLGRLAKVFWELNENIFKIELDSWLNENERANFEKLKNYYLSRLKKARNTVFLAEEKALEAGEYKRIHWGCYICPECQEKTLIPSNDSETGYKCVFCGNEESNEIETGCPACGDHPTLGVSDKGAKNYFCFYHKIKYS